MTSPLSNAINAMSQTSWIPTDSSVHLLARVRASPHFDSAQAKHLVHVPALDGAVGLQPIQVLHNLALATAPRYGPGIHDAYLKWGILRYLGFFDLEQMPGPLRLSAAARGIVGNQRRVTSEEMGIGFGTVVARQWFANSVGWSTPVSIVDVDVALNRGFVVAGGSKKRVLVNGPRRPDYLLLAHDRSLRGKLRVRSLECKGSRNPSTSLAQLAKGVGQLSGITVNGRVPQGLATATEVADNHVRSRILDPDDGRFDDDLTVEFDVDRAGSEDEDLDLGQLGRDIPEQQLGSALVAASFSALAEFAANDSAVARWAPQVLRERTQPQDRSRLTVETPFGSARGYSISTTFAGERITLQYLLSESVDRMMTQGSTYESIVETQANFAEQYQPERLDPGFGSEGFSATTDGSIFSITAD